MKIFQLLEMYSIKPETLDTFTSRRNAFAKLGSFGKKVAMAAIPVGFASVAGNKAYAATMEPLDVLNFALTLEYLEAEYYTKGLAASGLIPAGKDRAIFELIEKHEVDHVAFLIAGITASGGTPVSKPTFDFTVGGAFNPFGNYEQFLALAQAFEDTGVRAYKGQAANLMSNKALLTAALQIHSVEARHASEVRRLRGLKGWITQNERGAGMPEATQAVYNGENNLMQGGVDVTTVTTIGSDGITESFDEPLTKEEVLTIAGLFIAA
ncbi:ferritin-like domain-containing protein [Rhodonellum sp.]|uniref:ferritin-like domain-containing protein n=1 Tax=Rhodonellum sp. TaxID=2231180 RepID=UPI00271E1685|nr:ferritin-like domain-containing protein [Rhodonellum sp.]MDO9554433.1 ferritin-like domain-containing protein [Rhodonellum sp.]